jgi:hypothetical protein
MQALAEPFIFRSLSFGSLDKVRQAARALESGDVRRKVSRWTRTLRFMLSAADSSTSAKRDTFAECAATIISHSRALVELDALFFLFPTERMVAAAVEAAEGTLRRLKLAFARDTSPALWVAVGNAVHLQSLHLYTAPINPFVDWEAVGPWNLPRLKRLELDLDRYWLPAHNDGIFIFLGRCT